MDLSELPAWHIDADADGFGDPEGDTFWQYVPSGAVGMPGGVYVALSPLYVPVVSAITITNEDAAVSQAGTSLASGDWSGDGVDDLIIGAGWGDVVMNIGPASPGDLSMQRLRGEVGRGHGVCDFRG